jgi:signal transduction histidine kinase
MIRPIADEKNVRIELVKNDLEECLVFCDRETILQVLSNLAGNAVKFTGGGGVVQIGIKKCETEIRFAISDTGAGIPSKNLAYLFDRFWQARQTQRLGTGLGLSIAKGIVEAHKGKIWVESEIGKGSTFYFTIPKKPPSKVGLNEIAR